ncbi:MAG: tetratricopeptide repeat protein [Hyphomicrobiales bacterium]|nr:tetratricopeptide repeat protein [Hyphomicrobiales bacterium]
MKAGFWALILNAAVLISPAPAVAQDFDAGLSAYNIADYATAFGNWWPLSMRGDGKSQAALGYLYFKGLGVGQNASTAALWFNRAADKGQPTAQFFLGTLYLEGRGVSRDFARAYMWCDLALSNGFPAGLACRDEAALRMDAEDFVRSSHMTVEWRRAHQSR